MDYLSNASSEVYSLKILRHFGTIILEGWAFGVLGPRTLWNIERFQSVFGRDSYKKFRGARFALEEQYHAKPNPDDPLANIDADRLRWMLSQIRNLALSRMVLEALERADSQDTGLDSLLNSPNYILESPFDNDDTITQIDLFLLSARTKPDIVSVVNIDIIASELLTCSIKRFLYLLLSAPSIREGFLFPQAYAIGKLIAWRTRNIVALHAWLNLERPYLWTISTTSKGRICGIHGATLLRDR